MLETKQCPECGSEMPSDAPAGHCPECLLKLGMGGPPPGEQPAETVEGSPPSPSTFKPPKPSELAEYFPQLELLDLVGWGGMGAVYKARQTSLDRLVAIKIIKADLANDPGFAERFDREAKALAKLSHPHIVGVHDFGKTSGMYYLIMEYVDGTDLRRLIESKELKAEQALSIVPQVCEALQFAHDEGVVHRDIKPENILVDSRGRVKIADFGLAKLAGAASQHTLTGTHQVMGTPRYMAPEQMEGSHAVDHRADIYSLGVVFYELLTGELPLGRFDAPSQKAALDARLDEIVMRALAKEPPRRYQHASDFKSEVEQFSAHRPPLDQTVASVAPPKPAKTSSMQFHVMMLGWIHIAFGSIFLMIAAVVFVAITGGGIISQDADAIRVTSIVGTSVGAFLVLLSLPGIIAGFGLLKLRQWARVVTLILAILNLLNLPLGTALSIYAFWVLLHEETNQLFASQ